MKRLTLLLCLLVILAMSAWSQAIPFTSRGAWAGSTTYNAGDYFTCASPAGTYYVGATFVSGASCAADVTAAYIVPLTYNSIGVLPDEVLKLSWPRLINNLYFIGQNMLTGSSSPALTGFWNFRGASRSLPDRVGTGSPVARDACLYVGESYFQSDAAAGANVWRCTTIGTPGTWTLSSGAVTSVANKTGVVTLSNTDISGLGNSATRNVGAITGTVAAGDDSRLSDARTPTSHASTHAAAGGDPVTLTEAQTTGLTADLAARDLVTPVTTLPAASSATVGRIYRWSAAVTANICPSGGGSGGSASAFCVTLDGSTYISITGGSGGLPYHDYGTVSSSVTLDAATYGYVKYTLSGNAAITVTGGSTSQSLVIASCENGTGGFSPNLPGNVVGADYVDTTASACTTQAFRYDGTAFNASAKAAVTGVSGSYIRISSTGYKFIFPAPASDQTAATTNTAQTISGDKTHTGALDASAASKTLPFQAGLIASLPGTCTVGQVYFATDGVPARKIQSCTATNTWTPIAYNQGTIAGIPATCTVGQTYFATDATAGQNWYGCTATNTWSALGGGSIAAGANISVSGSTVSYNNFDFAHQKAIENFPFTETADGRIGALHWHVSGTGSSAGLVNRANNGAGKYASAYYCSTSGTSSNICMLSLSGEVGTGANYYGQMSLDTWEQHFIFTPQSLTSVIYRIGLNDLETSTATGTQNAMFLEYDSTNTRTCSAVNWCYVMVNNVTSTNYYDTGIAASTSGHVHFRMRSTAAGVVRFSLSTNDGVTFSSEVLGGSGQTINVAMPTTGFNPWFWVQTQTTADKRLTAAGWAGAFDGAQK